MLEKKEANELKAQLNIVREYVLDAKRSLDKISMNRHAPEEVRDMCERINKALTLDVDELARLKEDVAKRVYQT